MIDGGWIVGDVNDGWSRARPRCLCRCEMRDEQNLRDNDGAHLAEAHFMNARETHNPEPIRHLYVHFPFCARLCPYCAFYKTRGSSADIASFCRPLVLEAETVASIFPLS